jgi:sec-independent protein translocase protein TatC
MPRMSFGDHLEELRTCLMRSFLGVGAGTIFALIFGREILSIIFQPLFAAQVANGLPPSLQALAPTAGFTAYLKIGFLSGLVLTMPWVLYQLWKFVATGLYKHEQRFIRRMIPGSLGLFVLGVLFLYLIVLPIVLNFFIRFNHSFSPPDPRGPSLFRFLLPAPEEEKEVQLPPDLGSAPLLEKDPESPGVGALWINTSDNRLKISTPTGIQSVALQQDASTSSLSSQFAIDFYISFVLMLALAFGIAFQLPIVVFFLAWSRIVPASGMARARRYVLFGIVIAAAMLTPPDVISQLLLAVPMYGLFELGLLIARITERGARTAT